MLTLGSNHKVNWKLQSRVSTIFGYHARRNTISFSKNDIKAIGILETDRKQKHKWYNRIDDWHGNNTCVYTWIFVNAK